MIQEYVAMAQRGIACLVVGESERALRKIKRFGDPQFDNILNTYDIFVYVADALRRAKPAYNIGLQIKFKAPIPGSFSRGRYIDITSTRAFFDDLVKEELLQGPKSPICNYRLTKKGSQVQERVYDTMRQGFAGMHPSHKNIVQEVVTQWIGTSRVKISEHGSKILAHAYSENPRPAQYDFSDPRLKPFFKGAAWRKDRTLLKS